MATFSIAHRTVLITGGNSGIGKATAAALAQRSARVVITTRDPKKVARALADLGAHGHVEAMHLDLASLASVRHFATEFLAGHDDLAVLINNAGVISGRRKLTQDGFELTFGVNHLGHFLLTNLLLDRLLADVPSRVVNVSSGAHHNAKSNLDLADWHTTNRYRPFDAYARSKLANVLFTRELARRLEGTGVTAYALHPGLTATNIALEGDVRGLGWAWRLGRLFAQSPEQAARTVVYLATEPGIEDQNGGYFYEVRPARPNRLARDEEAARRLWEVSEELVDVAQ